MNNSELDRDSYCRFCAKRKHADKMYNLKTDTEKYTKVHNQLVFMNIDFVDLSDQNSLPKTVCLICFEAFNDAHQFIFNLKHAQSALDSMFSTTKSDTLTMQIEPEIKQSFKEVKNEKDSRRSVASDSEDEGHFTFFQYNTNDLQPDPCKGNEDYNNIHNFSKGDQSISPIDPPSIDLSTENQSNADSSNTLYSNNFGLHFLLQTGQKDIPATPDGLRLLMKNAPQITDKTDCLRSLLQSASKNVSVPPDVNEEKKVKLKNKPKLKRKSKPGVAYKNKVTSWAGYNWKCQHCGDEFPTYGSMRGHSKQIHNKCYAYYCRDCPDLDFDNAQRFATHIRKHFRFLGKVCFFCDEQHQELYIHEYEAHKQTNFCHLCGENFSTSDSLKLHIDTYSSGKAIKKSFSFTRKRGAPVTIDQLTCKVCSKVFSTTYQLVKHKEIHKEDRKRNHICETCGKTFYDKGYLNYHVNTVHYNTRDHVCRICQTTFASIKCLRNHVRNAHETHKPFACDTCGKTFKHNFELNTHKIIHSDSKPFECRFCPKTFRAKYGLKHHENIHTGDKNYSCSGCEKDFTNWGNYNKHMMRRHGINISKKKRTPQGSYPIDPNTGEIICATDAASQEWKKQLLTQVKRTGKKKEATTAPIEMVEIVSEQGHTPEYANESLSTEV